MQTPYYLIDKSRLLPNMEKIAWQHTQVLGLGWDEYQRLNRCMVARRTEGRAAVSVAAARAPRSAQTRTRRRRRGATSPSPTRW